jgi:hypothetical protein
MLAPFLFGEIVMRPKAEALGYPIVAIPKRRYCSNAPFSVWDLGPSGDDGGYGKAWNWRPLGCWAVW